MRRTRFVAYCLCLAGVGGVCLPLHAQRPSPRTAVPVEEIVLRECLALKSTARGGRSALHTDPVEAKIVAGLWTTPTPGSSFVLPDGSASAWATVKAGADGVMSHPNLAGGYASILLVSPVRKVLLLEASGHGMVYVNGEPRTGDPYENGTTRLPIVLKPGQNEFLFPCSRGRLRAKLITPPAPAVIQTSDMTLPDLIEGEQVPVWASVIVVNATEQTLDRLRLTTSGTNVATLSENLPALTPLSVRKVAFRIGRTTASPGTCRIRLVLSRQGKGGRILNEAQIDLRVRRPLESQKRTFISEIDGSVQYYGLNPAQRLEKDTSAPALFLTLHGASVEAIGQADAYLAKSWGHLVAPTNRRPFGFDWEDWGRLDAMEVLEQATRRLNPDPRRIYLTGHSMGGHGTWHLGATFPDRFAAIGPSAGWISFFTYAGGRRIENPNPVEELLQRAVSPSETLALASNYKQEGVYILHGSADDNVPAEQARTMNKVLSEFHKDWVYFEQPGAGHWWDASDEPGADCVDWLPMFDFFARHSLADNASIRQVDFTTASPGVSSWCHWVGIEAQAQAMKPSHVDIRCDPGQRRFVGKTENVSRLCLNLGHLKPGSPVSVELDGFKMATVRWPVSGTHIWLQRADAGGTRGLGVWLPAESPPAALKGPHRYGPFKQAFRNRMLFVYGTRGTAEENAWSYAKARYDAETFWYRGNGSVDVIADTAFAPAKEPDRNVILYGNAETNAAWPLLLSNSPVQVRRNGVKVGERETAGSDLACLFLRPRPGSEKALVGVVGGTGAVGMRLTERLPVFLSGAAFPDCLVLGAETLTQGSAGVRCAGYFGTDWSVPTGEFAWRK